MPKPAREIATSLQQKGFKKKENDHVFFHLWIDGKKTSVYTKLSHGEKEVSDSLLGMMARQVKLNRRQFDNLIDCPLSAEDYIKLLKDSGHL